MYYDVVFKLLQFDTFCFFFFFNDTATTEIYTLSLHDALPIFPSNACPLCLTAAAGTELAGASSEGTVKCRRLSRRHPSFPLTGVYNPKAFVPHAASLRQAFAHCGKFPTAASRRSRDRVSVPVWLVVLSDQLPVIALVSHYLTN